MSQSASEQLLRYLATNRTRIWVDRDTPLAPLSDLPDDILRQHLFGFHLALIAEGLIPEALDPADAPRPSTMIPAPAFWNRRTWQPRPPIEAVHKSFDRRGNFKPKRPRPRLPKRRRIDQ